MERKEKVKDLITKKELSYEELKERYNALVEKQRIFKLKAYNIFVEQALKMSEFCSDFNLISLIILDYNKDFNPDLDHKPIE
ncbi:MAG TPA: hypothetical protein EYO35_05605 [Flavobacteriaceae bacterium]|nr:hypothetical protein [Flavobacteriaceae bacterium]